MPLRINVNKRGVRSLIVDLDEAADGIEQRVIDVMEDSGPMFVRSARQYVPVDTGALKRRIWFKTYLTSKNPRLRVGPMNSSPDRLGSDRNALKYAGFVHDGTSRMAARPFVTRAVRKHTTPQGKFMRGLRRAGVAGLGKSTGGL